MKFISTTLAIAVFALMVCTPSHARESVSVDFFYEHLDPYGSWMEIGDYGYAWQPHDVGRNWSPYSDGRWIYTDAGWTWDSREPYGWAVYHYGRWANIRQVGWVWVPGTEWGPAWVSWRHSPRHVGWAPLPPEASFRVSIGFSAWVDDYYNIGPGNYRFVEGRHFGSPRLNTVLIDQRQNVSIIQETTNITNITYQNNVVYNGGPAYDQLSRESSEPISRYKLDRRSRGQSTKELQSRVTDDTFSVVALPFVESAGGQPRKIAKKVAKAQANTGWERTGSRDETAELKTKLRSTTKVPKELPGEATFEKRGANQERPQAATRKTAKEDGDNRAARATQPAASEEKTEIPTRTAPRASRQNTESKPAGEEDRKARSRKAEAEKVKTRKAPARPETKSSPRGARQESRRQSSQPTASTNREAARPDQRKNAERSREPSPDQPKSAPKKQRGEQTPPNRDAEKQPNPKKKSAAPSEARSGRNPRNEKLDLRKMQDERAPSSPAKRGGRASAKPDEKKNAGSAEEEDDDKKKGRR